METRPENTIPIVTCVMPDPSAVRHIAVLRRPFWALLLFAIICCAGCFRAFISAPSAVSIIGIPIRYLIITAAITTLSLPFLLRFASQKQVSQWREEVRDNPPTPPDDAVGRQILAHWNEKRMLPKEKHVRRIIESSPPTERPRVYALGTVDPPEVGDRFFEPIVFTPGDMNRSSTASLWTGLVFAALSALAMLGWLPLPVPANTFLYQGIGFGVFGVLSFSYYVMFRPTYIRFAPGRIQFVRYRMLRKREPIIDDFSLAPGVVVVALADIFPIQRFRERLAKQNLYGISAEQILAARTTLLLFKEGRWRRIRPLRTGKSSGAFLEGFWNAVLSTARQPELGAALDV
ncbi:MAG TPA: hypothetical protein P5081_03030 [Phycisphaerae bacterium]|nr:hypothetical protein [Phycisphaerae bacterium]HRW51832.1 hypothetical protein [Phycisphaerae bacterium]